MKRKPRSLLCALMLSFCLFPVYAEQDSVIHISNTDDFVRFAEQCTVDSWSIGKTVVLDNDLDLSGMDVSIPVFGGVFEGNGHMISGVDIASDISPCGLFEVVSVSGVINRLSVSGTVSPPHRNTSVGGIAGRNEGRISNCGYSGSVKGHESVGGIAGYNTMSGVIDSCVSDGSVNGDENTGGTAGVNEGVIENCRSLNDVNATDGERAMHPEDLNLDFTLDMTKMSSMDTTSGTVNTGGIAGHSSGYIVNCTSSGTVGYPHVGYNVGGIAGRSSGHVSYCTSISDVEGRKDVGGIVGQADPYVVMQVSENRISQLEDKANTLQALWNQAQSQMDMGVESVSASVNGIASVMDGISASVSDIRSGADLSGQIEGNGNLQAGGSLDVNLPVPGDMNGSIEHENGVEAGSGIEGNASVNVSTDLSYLSSSISQMSGQLRSLSSSARGTSAALSSTLGQMETTLSEMGDLLKDILMPSDDQVITDVSGQNTDEIRQGKISDNRFTGSVKGDLNCGGITGAMSIEYENDPEDELHSAKDMATGTYEIRCVVVNCINEGSIVSRHHYAGGICGRMDIGKIQNCENYGSVTSENGDHVGGIAGMCGSVITRCYARSTLTGGNDVGGIVGTGMEKDVQGESSLISDCVSMVQINASGHGIGAIGGDDAGRYENNRYIGNTLQGINGRSYVGKAEETDYPVIAGEQNTPSAFLDLSLTFVDEGTVVKTVGFSYGVSLDSSVYPSLPVKEGYSVTWEDVDLNHLCFDVVVHAVYTPYLTTVAAEKNRDGKDILFVQGQFDHDAHLIAERYENGTEIPVSDHSFPRVVYEWFHRHDVEERWKITIPEDDLDTHEIRILSDENTVIYVKDNNAWQKAGMEWKGSYLAFEAEGRNVEFAVVNVSMYQWVWIVIGAIAMACVIAAGMTLHRRLKRGKIPEEEEKEEDEISEEEWKQMMVEMHRKEKARKRKHRRLKKQVRIVLCVIVVLAVVIVSFIHFYPSFEKLIAGMDVYGYLKDFGMEPYSLDVDIQGSIDNEVIHQAFEIDSCEDEGRTVVVVGDGEQSLYYHGNSIYLEDGTVFEIDSEQMEMNDLFDQMMTVYDHADIEHEGNTYTVKAEKEQAETILNMLGMDSDLALATYELLEMKAEEKDGGIDAVVFEIQGKTQLGKDIEITVQMRLCENIRGVIIPESVRSAIRNGKDGTSVIMTSDLKTLVQAWMNMMNSDTVVYEIRTGADCDLIHVQRQLEAVRWNEEEGVVLSVGTDGRTVYYGNDMVCDENGNMIIQTDIHGMDVQVLFDTMWKLISHTQIHCSKQQNETVYLLTADDDSIHQIMTALLPEVMDLDIGNMTGRIQIGVVDERITSMSVSIQGEILSLPALTCTVSLKPVWNASSRILPQAVKECLRSS